MPDDFTLANNVDYAVEQMYEFLSHHTLRRDIGAEYEYSTYGVGLLAHILTLRSAMSYEELVRRRIGDVIGLEDTRITLTPAMQRRLAKGHFLGFEMPNWDAPPTLAGAGGLRSTARDMLRFLAANMGLEETPLYAAMQLTHQPRIEAGGAGMHVGLGWRMRVSGVCRSWVMAASIWVRWKICWRMRACIALKAALACRISEAPASCSGG